MTRLEGVTHSKTFSESAPTFESAANLNRACWGLLACAVNVPHSSKRDALHSKAEQGNAERSLPVTRTTSHTNVLYPLGAFTLLSWKGAALDLNLLWAGIRLCNEFHLILNDHEPGIRSLVPDKFPTGVLPCSLPEYCLSAGGLSDSWPEYWRRTSPYVITT